MPTSKPSSITDRSVWLGVVALSCYATHGAVHWLRGTPENMLWGCQLGALFIGLGLLSRSPALNGVGLLWLSAGTPFWLVGLVLGSNFLPTSVLTHVGGLLIGLWGARALGLPRGLWCKALGSALAVHLISRLITPEQRNINLANEVWPGFDGWFDSHTLFIVVVSGVASVVFLAVESGLRRALRLV